MAQERTEERVRIDVNLILELLIVVPKAGRLAQWRVVHHPIPELINGNLSTLVRVKLLEDLLNGFLLVAGASQVINQLITNRRVTRPYVGLHVVNLLPGDGKGQKSANSAISDETNALITRVLIINAYYSLLIVYFDHQMTINI